MIELPPKKEPDRLARDMATVARAGATITIMDTPRPPPPQTPMEELVAQIALMHNHGVRVKLDVRTAIDILLSSVDPDPSREGLRETPSRVQKAWEHWTSGYAMQAEHVLKVFEDGGENYDEMVVVKDIPIYSKCEHHLADIFGTATIAYIPDGQIVGLSKLSRLADMHARRLQVQERLTNDIAEDLWRCLAPKGVGVLVRARHMCMESRGLCQQGHHTITVALRGAMKEQGPTRAEFMALAAAGSK